MCEDANLYAVFEQYLVTQFSEENLHFYNEVTKLHTMTEQSEINEVAQRLCKDYFGLGQDETRLNVSLSIRDKVLKALERPTPTMFDEAYNDIEQVLKVRLSGLSRKQSEAKKALSLQIERHTAIFGLIFAKTNHYRACMSSLGWHL